MKITRILIYSYELPLSENIDAGGSILSGRKGLIVAIHDNESKTGYGEISPLPGCDRESLEECSGQLASFKKKFQGTELGLNGFNPSLPFFGLTKDDAGLGPAAMFGIESAFLMLCGMHGKGIIAEMKKKGAGKAGVMINGLYYPGGGAGQAGYLRGMGFRSVKIKIGRIDRKREIGEIKSLSDSLGDNVAIRLDGNRSLDMKSVMEYHDALRDLNVEYIEEPLMEGIAPGLPWPAAIDESIGDHLDTSRPDFGLLPEYCRALVLKPGSLRGLHNMIRAVSWGRSSGRTITLSSAFNGGPAISMLGIASFFGGTELGNAHGLGTIRYLKSDILKERLVIKNGILEIPFSVYDGAGALDYEKLTEVQ
jgi:o-succinylbenzoate synthase